MQRWLPFPMAPAQVPFPMRDGVPAFCSNCIHWGRLRDYPGQCCPHRTEHGPAEVCGGWELRSDADE